MNIIHKISFIYGEIALAQEDVIVNAANGCGYMGGKRSRKKICSGVAEHINYYSRGRVEREASKAARKNTYISSWLCGHDAGTFFVTGSGGLGCKKIVHAVTMRYPGSRSSIQAVEQVVEKVFEYCYNSGFTSVAIPCLGCGTGGLNKDNVIDIIRRKAKDYPELDIRVYQLFNEEQED